MFLPPSEMLQLPEFLFIIMDFVATFVTLALLVFKIGNGKGGE